MTELKTDKGCGYELKFSQSTDRSLFTAENGFVIGHARYYGYEFAPEGWIDPKDRRIVLGGLIRGFVNRCILTAQRFGTDIDLRIEASYPVPCYDKKEPLGFFVDLSYFPREFSEDRRSDGYSDREDPRRVRLKSFVDAESFFEMVLSPGIRSNRVSLN